MSYTTEHYHFDLLRDYMNGATEPHQWEELRDFALDILDAYAERFDSVAERFNAPDPGLPHILAEDVAP